MESRKGKKKKVISRGIHLFQEDLFHGAQYPHSTRPNLVESLCYVPETHVTPCVKCPPAMPVSLAVTPHHKACPHDVCLCPQATSLTPSSEGASGHRPPFLQHAKGPPCSLRALSHTSTPAWDTQHTHSATLSPQWPAPFHDPCNSLSTFPSSACLFCPIPYPPTCASCNGSQHSAVPLCSPQWRGRVHPQDPTQCEHSNICETHTSQGRLVTKARGEKKNPMVPEEEFRVDYFVFPLTEDT